MSLSNPTVRPFADFLPAKGGPFHRANLKFIGFASEADITWALARHRTPRVEPVSLSLVQRVLFFVLQVYVAIESSVRVAAMYARTTKSYLRHRWDVVKSAMPMPGEMIVLTDEHPAVRVWAESADAIVTGYRVIPSSAPAAPSDRMWLVARLTLTGGECYVQTRKQFEPSPRLSARVRRSLRTVKLFVTGVPQINGAATA